MYENEKGKRSWTSRLVQIKKKELLKSIGADRGASHGGDLQGRGCTNFLQHADKFFSKCIEIDEAAVRQGTAAASLDKVRLVNGKFKRLAYLLDNLLHYVYMDHSAVKLYGDNLREDISACKDAFIWMWHYLRISMVGAKYHLIKDHLIKQLDHWGAIGPYNEEFGESDHVDGNKELKKLGTCEAQLEERLQSRDIMR